MSSKSKGEPWEHEALQRFGESLLGLPWAIAERLWQRTDAPYTTKEGENYARFFAVAEEGPYVARLKAPSTPGEAWEFLLYLPMVDSHFREAEAWVHCSDHTARREGMDDAQCGASDPSDHSTRSEV